ncbi:hypothetical protein ABGV42_02095 [Paenibacillus pabuli]|uniref:hypothetical protein n=1 Tax=Paenibacillus pabuli TaxID=1472 RepID=UPI0032423B32
MENSRTNAYTLDVPVIEVLEHGEILDYMLAVIEECNVSNKNELMEALRQMSTSSLLAHYPDVRELYSLHIRNEALSVMCEEVQEIGPDAFMKKYLEGANSDETKNYH